jgi:hypothetical protein
MLRATNIQDCLPKRRNTKDMLPEAARSNVLRRRMSEGRTGNCRQNDEQR